jgi:hypothetical protein
MICGKPSFFSNTCSNCRSLADHLTLPLNFHSNIIREYHAQPTSLPRPPTRRIQAQHMPLFDQPLISGSCFPSNIDSLLYIFNYFFNNSPILISPSSSTSNFSRAHPRHRMNIDTTIIDRLRKAACGLFCAQTRRMRLFRFSLWWSRECYLAIIAMLGSKRAQLRRQL